MGIFDRFRRKKKDKRPGDDLMPGGPTPGVSPSTAAYQRSAMTGSMRAEMDLILSQMETLRIQYEAINTRLQNIERLVTEIRSFCK
jgi:hypothetical protein